MYLSQLIYVSLAAEQFSEDQLHTLELKSAQDNSLRDVTGILYCRHGVFLQVLEGPMRQVNELFEVIKRDPRHMRVKMLSFLPIKRRSFEDWAMKFCDLDKLADIEVRPIQKQLEVYANDTMDSAWEPAELCRRIIHAFEQAAELERQPNLNRSKPVRDAG